MEAEALCSAGGGDPAGAVGRVLGPRLAPSPAQAQRSPGRAPEPTSRRLGREHCTDWGTSLEGDHGLGVVEEGESPKLHGAGSGTPDLGTDGPEEGPVCWGLALSVPPPTPWEGARRFEGKERLGLSPSSSLRPSSRI